MPRMSRTDRRAQIARGAMIAMAEHGYERATIQKIAHAAQITPGLIHYHFDSKQQILMALLEELEARHTARYDAELERQRAELRHDPLDAFIEAHLGLEHGVDAEALRSWVAISAEAVHVQEVREVFARAIATQHALLVDVLHTRHACPAPEAAELAATILSMIQGVFLLSQASPELLPAGFAARQLRASVRGMLFLATAR